MISNLKKFIIACSVIVLNSCAQDIGVIKNYTEEINIYGDPIIQTSLIYNQAVDILFIVDESGSMVDEQESLSLAIPGIYNILIGDKFTNLDWRVGIRSTDPTGEIYGWVDFDDSDALLKLMSLTLLLENHSKEQGLDSAIEVAAWDVTGFKREQADFLIIFISDEPDQSSISVSDYTNLMSFVKQSPFEVTESAIVATYEEDRCNNAIIGAGYIDVSETIVDLCDSNWEAVLDRPLEHLPTLNQILPLEYFPLEIDRLKVFISEDGNEAKIYEKWVYDEVGNAVILTEIPKAGSVLTIVYTI